MKTIGYCKELNNLQIPDELKKSLGNYLQLLDENYGDSRDIKADLGGYGIVVESVNDVMKIKRDTIKGVIPEDVEEIKCGDG